MRATTRILPLALAGVLLPGLALGQQLPAHQRGISADTAFQLGDLETINLFNGGLTLRIPIGPSYPVGPDLQFQIQLVYGSNFWGSESRNCTLDGMVKKFTFTDREQTNAGLGWHVGFGHLYAPGEPLADDDGWRYVDPMGGVHRFYDRIQPEYPDAPHPNESFTQDGTYLRMRLVPGSPVMRFVDLPNGTSHEFQEEHGAWRIQRIEDVHGNWISFDWQASGSATITDIHQRTHLLNATTGRLSSITPSGYSSWDFEYDFSETVWRNDATLPLGGTWKDDCDGPGEASLPAQEIPVPYLEEVTLPNGSSYSMFDGYQTEGGEDSGLIQEMTLPTGGVYEWEWFYRRIPPPFEQTDITIFNDNYFTRSNAVSERRHRTGVGADPEVWSYASDFTVYGNSGPDGCSLEVTVTDPEGDESVHFFSVDGSTTMRGFYGLPIRVCDEDGVAMTAGPFESQQIWDGDTDTGTLLRTVSVLYTGSGTQMGSGGYQDKNNRMTYQRTEFQDDLDASRGGVARRIETTWSDFDGLGHFRQVETFGDFETDAPRGSASREVKTAYDVSGGSYVIDPMPEMTNEGPSVVPPNFPGFVDPWILGTYTQKEVRENGLSAITDTCFDAATGLLERQRTRAEIASSPTIGTTDHLVVTEYDDDEMSENRGFPISMRYYGGDTTPLPGAFDEVCDDAEPTGAAFEQQMVYDGGMQKTADWVIPGTTTSVLRTVDQTIDVAAARVSASRDAAGRETAFAYDDLGRVEKETPPGNLAQWVYDYVDSPPQLTMCLRGDMTEDCATAGVLSFQDYRYDGLGRLVREDLRFPQPGGVALTECRGHEYDDLGRKTVETTWDAAPSCDSGSTPHTDFEVDRFGRVVEISPPLVGIHHVPTTIEYLGTRKVRRTVGIQGGPSADPETLSSAIETYDSFGRLAGVCEGASAPADWETCTDGVEAAYGYGVLGNLASVEMDTQTRTFTYDGRGLLTSEEHPEIDGEVSYTYDALGNVVSKTIPSVSRGTSEGEGVQLFYTYDPAGRLTLVEEIPPGGVSRRPVKVLRYARTDDPDNADNLRKGKLVQAIRHNYVQPLPISLDLARGGASGSLSAQVSHTYEYDHPAGLLSSRLSSVVIGGEHRVFRMDVGYDALGQVADLTYPECLQHPCSADTPARTVTMDRDLGFLTEIGDASQSAQPLAKLGYQTGGMLAKIEHLNNVDETISVNSFEMFQRPFRIETTGSIGGTFDTGFMAYDSAGNLFDLSLGGGGVPLSFEYDRLGRMVREKRDGTNRQVATFDEFGNLTALSTSPGFAVDASTNRLTDGSQATGVTYDARGSLTSITLAGESARYDYDAMNLQRTVEGEGDIARTFLYDADDERIATFDCASIGSPTCPADPGSETWTLRGLDGMVLRVFTKPWFGDDWSWQRDYVYRSGLPFATIFRTGTPSEPDEDRFHFHLDHLGSIRQVTDTSAIEVARHDYYAFGEEETSPNQSTFQLRYTGHERDDESGAELLLDYMHARHCSPVLGTFLSIDPIVSSDPRSPTSWNKYAYGANNPVRFVDRTGEAIETGWDAFNVGLGVASLGSNLLSGNFLGAAVDVGGIALDLGATVVPGLPGGAGAALKAARLERARKATQARRFAASSRAGRAFEKKVLAALGLEKNKVRIVSASGTAKYRIPDGIGVETIVEVKGVAQLRYTDQLSDFLDFAKRSGRQLVIVAEERTSVDRRLLDLVEDGTLVILRAAN